MATDQERAARLEAIRARRGTPEREAAIAKLMAAKAPKRKARPPLKPLTFDQEKRAVRRLIKRFDAMLADAAADSGLEPDVIAHDIWQSAVIDARGRRDGTGRSEVIARARAQVL